jgi:hypothetical protein
MPNREWCSSIRRLPLLFKIFELGITHACHIAGSVNVAPTLSHVPGQNNSKVSTKVQEEFNDTIRKLGMAEKRVVFCPHLILNALFITKITIAYMCFEDQGNRIRKRFNCKAAS